jgi:hypothetical protein
MCAPHRELDLKILQEALSREASDEAREAAAREKRAEDVRRYREQLALMIEKVGAPWCLPHYEAVLSAQDMHYSCGRGVVFQSALWQA